jgi:hypothetical protein
LLFRVRNDQRLPREVELPDGSYLSTLYPTEKARRQRMEGVRVRVIEYALDGIEEAEPLYRLITNWLEPERHRRNWRRYTTVHRRPSMRVHLADRPWCCAAPSQAADI